MTNIDSRRDFLTLAETAAILRCSKGHVSNLTNGKIAGVPKLPSVTFGRRKVIRPDTLSQWSEMVESKLDTDPDSEPSVTAESKPGKPDPASEPSAKCGN